MWLKDDTSRLDIDFYVYKYGNQIGYVSVGKDENPSDHVHHLILKAQQVRCASDEAGNPMKIYHWLGNTDETEE